MISTTVKPSTSHTNINTNTNTNTRKHIIDLTDCVVDTTANIIYDSEYSQLPSDIFENTIFEALNDLIDDFAINPDRYLKLKHQQRIDRIAREYLQDEPN